MNSQKFLESEKHLLFIDNNSISISERDTNNTQLVSRQSSIQWKVKDRSLYISIDLHEFQVPEDKISTLKPALRNYNQKGITNFYRQICQIGKGAQGKIMLIEDNYSQKKFAVKCVNKDADNQEINREIDILRSISHPNIVKLEEVFESNKQYYLIFEPLQRILRMEYDHNEIKLILQQILQGLDYLHSKNIMHRDLKFQNIMFDNDNVVKIIDFGFSAYTTDRNIQLKKCGTPGYIAPEIFLCQTDEDFYNEKCDMFSLGAIMYELYTKDYLIKGSQEELVMSKNKLFKCQYSSSSLPHILDHGTDLLRNLLQPNPRFRYSAAQALKHQYFQEQQPQIAIRNIEPKFKSLLN